MTNTLFTRDSRTILSALPLIAAGLFLMYVVQSLCKYYVSYQGHMMGANMERDMRQQLFDHYEKLSSPTTARNNSGQMMSKLVSDLFDIAEFAHHGPENLFISVVKIAGSFIFLFLINWQLALPLVVLVLCMFFFTVRQNTRMQETFMENRRKIGDVNSSLRTRLPASGSYNHSQTKTLSAKNFTGAIRRSCSPSGITTAVWAISWAGTCSFRHDVSGHTGLLADISSQKAGWSRWILPCMPSISVFSSIRSRSS